MIAPSLFKAPSVDTITKVLTWTAPAIAIPALRYTQDSHQRRAELFIRDASTYTIGALLFLGTDRLTKKILDFYKIFQKEESRKLTAFLVGLTLNLLYAGIGAVHLSKLFTKKTTPPVVTPIANANYLPTTTFVQTNPRMQYFV